MRLVATAYERKLLYDFEIAFSESLKTKTEADIHQQYSLHFIQVHRNHRDPKSLQPPAIYAGLNVINVRYKVKD